jgi:hypothetical protein
LFDDRFRINRDRHCPAGDRRGLASSRLSILLALEPVKDKSKEQVKQSKHHAGGCPDPSHLPIRPGRNFREGQPPGIFSHKVIEFK